MSAERASRLHAVDGDTPVASVRRTTKTEEPMSFDTAPDVLTVPEAAALLRLGINKAYRAVRDGTIPSFKVGRSIRVYKRDVAGLAEGGGGR